LEGRKETFDCFSTDGGTEVDLLKLWARWGVGLKEEKLCGKVGNQIEKKTKSLSRSSDVGWRQRNLIQSKVVRHSVLASNFFVTQV
jgi:predicted methyltransferase